MQAHTKKPHTDEIMLIVSCPAPKAGDAKAYLEKMGCLVDNHLDAKQVFPDRSAGTLLVGARYREGLTQAQLAKISGVPRRHISEMENNRRTIGKGNARKLAGALNIDYRILL